MSAAALARRLQRPANRITAILNGQRSISGDTTLRLAHFFGTSGEFWPNLQTLYDVRVAEITVRKSIQASTVSSTISFSEVTMRLLEPIEKTGLFWLPEDSDYQLPGVLRVSKSGEVTLEVNYVYDPYERMNHRRLGYPPEGSEDSTVDRIVGLLDKQAVTLEFCRYLNWDVFHGAFTGVSTSTIRADRAFVGFNFGLATEVKFSNIIFSLEGLDEWLRVDGFRVQRHKDGRGGVIKYRRPKDIIVRLPEDIKLKFTFAWRYPSIPVIREACIKQKAYISLFSRKLRTFEYFDDLIKRIHNFFRFATDSTVSIDEITGFSNQIIQEDLDRPLKTPVNIYFKRLPYAEMTEPINWRTMVFNYRELESSIEVVLTKWLQNHDNLESAFNLYFASRSGVHMFLESQFLLLVQGVETLHRGISGIERAELRNRIESIVRPFNIYFGDGDEIERFILLVRDTRNYLTHHNVNLSQRTATGQDLLNLTRRLEALFQLQLLSLLGMNPQSIDRIVNKNKALRYKLGL